MTSTPTKAFADRLFKEKYSEGNENRYDTLVRVAAALSRSDADRRELKELLFDGAFTPAGRILRGAGASADVTLGNCFVMPRIEDNTESIFEVVTKSFQTLRRGGGIGLNFSRLRPDGANIVSLGSRASGPLSFMGIWDAVCKTTASAGHRRGAMMGVLHVSHPDIEAFIDAKHDNTTLTSFNLSVLVDDRFMKAVEEDAPYPLEFGIEVHKVVRARALWDKIMRSTYDYAEPGVLFEGNMNRTNNLRHLEHLDTTNPCLHPDSMVETVEGRKRIVDIAEPTEVYTMMDDGSLGLAKCSAAFISKRNAELIEVELASGHKLRCTPDHKVHTDDGWVEAKDLVIGESNITHLCRAPKSDSWARVKLSTETYDKYVPEHRFVAQADDSKDVHHLNGNPFDNRRCNLEVLDHGAHSSITVEETWVEPEDRDAGGHWVGSGVRRTKRTMRQMPDDMKSGLVNQFSRRVVSIREVESEDVYDLTVEGTHNFIAEYMVVHNCAEQPLPENGACVLGSLNLTKFLEDKEQAFDLTELAEATRTAVRALDVVHDLGTMPLPEQNEESVNKRRIGLGVFGYASALSILRLPYGSKYALKILEDALATIRDAAYEASAELASELGAYPLYEEDKVLAEGTFASALPDYVLEDIRKHGLRNSHLLSIAPTGTISLVSGNVSGGIEPIFSICQERDVHMPEGKQTIDLLEYAYDRYGEVPDVHASNATVKNHLDTLILAQSLVDSSVSKTVNVGDGVDWEGFKDIYMRAWKEGCKGCTTFRAAGKRFGMMRAKSGGDSCTFDPQTGRKTCDDE